MNTTPTFGPVLGLKAGELARYSLGDMISAMVRDDKGALAPYVDFSRTVAQQTGQEPLSHQYLNVPGDLLTRDMTVAGVSGSQYMVGTTQISFSDAYRKRSIVEALAVTRHESLVSNATILREVSPHTTTWLSDETTQIADGQATIGQLSMLPHTVSTIVTASRMTLTQGAPAVNGFVVPALAGAMAEAFDSAFLSGTNLSGQPMGLLTMPGTDTRTGSTFTLAMAAAMLKVADGRQRPDTIAWIAGVDAAEDLRTREAASGSGFLLRDGKMLDRSVLVSRCAPAASLAVAQWSDTHVAQWGALQIGVDPYTLFSTGRVRIRALWSVDFAHDQAGQIAVATAVS